MIYTDFELIPILRYGMIMADPPWNFRTYSRDGANKKGAAGQYAVWDLDAIKALKVNYRASKDCVLWLWALNPMLPQALEVMAAWGFTFKTAGHWVKRGASGKLAFGPGYILRGAGEPFLIGTVGRPEFANNVRSVIEGPRREHSRKPDEAFAAAEKLVPNVRRLELFSREARPGWDVFGDEVGKFEQEDSGCLTSSMQRSGNGSMPRSRQAR